MSLFAGQPAEGAVQAVPYVDLGRYAGKWYEIARLPNRFQRNCSAGTSATYSVRSDGKIDVLNECRAADGRVISAKGVAKLASASGPPSKLKVTFFWPFYGNYWIIELDPEYRWAVVGEPGRKYLWILAREPHLDDELYNRIAERIRTQGYELAGLIKTPQGQ